MQKVSLSIIFIVITAFFVSYASAQDYYYDPVYRSSIGLGGYYFGVDYDSKTFDEDAFSGLSVHFTYSIMNYAAIRAGAASTNSKDDSSVSSVVFESLFLMGTNFMFPGPNLYIGAGFFKDSRDDTRGVVNESFSGGQICIGIGYKWTRFGLDLWASTREASDYRKYFEEKTGTAASSHISATSVTAMLYYRF